MKRKIIALLLALVFSFTFVCPALAFNLGGNALPSGSSGISLPGVGNISIPSLPSSPSGGGLPNISLPSIPGLPAIPGTTPATPTTPPTTPTIPTTPTTPPTIPEIPVVIPDIGSIPELPTNEITFDDVAKFIQSDQFKQTLAQIITYIPEKDLKEIQKYVPPEVIKALYTGMITNNQAKTQQAMDKIIAGLLQKYAPQIAAYAAESLADLMISQGYPGTKDELKAKLYPVVLSVITGQTPPDTAKIQEKLIAAGVDAQFAPYLAYGIALMASDQMIDIMAPVVAMIIVDLIGKVIGVPIPASIKAQLVAKLTPIIAKIMKQGKTVIIDAKAINNLDSMLQLKPVILK
ncbi:Uncharacterized [Syntrophomonas zehnderi OL-4]|uniref:Uncharacterized n=1 Tax=Syntrophomonas zehnderi OL-4 TaxID=690567 RepID=A0A0E4C8I9_9FIRM|nr:hypothetical protein [Syntrophomonas zehnderi]CFX47928.1 Uncharacterized [Syntrophomonas zehnderi OL-4]